MAQSKNLISSFFLAALAGSASAPAALAACTSAGTVVTCTDSGFNPDTTSPVRFLPPTTTDIILMSGYDVLTSAGNFGGVGVDIYTIVGGVNLSIDQRAGSTVRTTGGNADFGMRALSLGGISNLTVTQSGTVTTTGAVSADAVHVESMGSGNLSILQTSTGVATTTGGGGIGLYASSNGGGSGITSIVQQVGGLVNAMNQGVWAGYGTSTTVDIAGTVIATADGVTATNSSTGGGSVRLRSTSRVTGAFSGATVRASGGGNAATVVSFTQDAGSILTGGATGVFMENSNSNSTIQAIIAGSIITTQTAASDRGVLVQNAGGGYTTANIMIAATGSISGSATNAIRSYHAATTIDNSGSIAGNINMSSSDFFLSNSNVTADALINRSGATYSGSMWMGGGNDTVDLLTGSTTSGVIQMGDGSDTISVATGANIANITNFDGGDDTGQTDTYVDNLNITNQSIALATTQFNNFENINLNNTILNTTGAALNAGSGSGNGVFLTNGSRMIGDGAFAMGGNLNLASGTRLELTGNGLGTPTLNGSLVNNGIVDLADGAAGDLFTINGNYSGGGNFELDAFVDGSGAVVDQIAITGNSSGTGTIRVNNAGLAGAPTTGNGIELVTVGGTSSGTFALSAPVVSGAFNYSLDRADGQNWFLRSAARGGSTGAAVVGDEVSDVAMTFLGTRHERFGELQNQRDEGSNLWGRMIGKSTSGTSTAAGLGDVATGNNIAGFQAGMDILGSDTGASVQRFGAYFGAASAQGHANDDATSANGYVGGLYASRDVKNDYYIDAVLQGTMLDLSADASVGSMATKGQGWLGSIEAGKDFQLTQTSFLEAQLQLIYGGQSIDDAVDSGGIANSFTSTNKLTGRAGLRLKGSSEMGSSGHQAAGWLKANIWQNLSGGDQTASIGPSTIAVAGHNSWLDVGIGIEVKDASGLAIFADGDLEFGLDAKYTAFTGKAGVKLAF